MENLNKENFFNAITTKYPGAMIKFHEWIDAYKASVDWPDLFNEGVRTRTIKTPHSLSVQTITDYSKKFHEIPYEMQFGILLKFVAEVLNNADINEQVIGVHEMKVLLEGCFQELQHKIKLSVSDLQEQDLKNIKRHGVSNNGI